MTWNVKLTRDFVSFFFCKKILLLNILDDIHLGVNRLKMLALHMNEELESQKPLTEDLDRKLKILNDNVTKKNKDMKTILLR